MCSALYRGFGATGPSRHIVASPDGKSQDSDVTLSFFAFRLSHVSFARPTAHDEAVVRSNRVCKKEKAIARPPMSKQQRTVRSVPRSECGTADAARRTYAGASRIEAV